MASRIPRCRSSFTLSPLHPSPPASAVKKWASVFLPTLFTSTTTEEEKICPICLEAVDTPAGLSNCSCTICHQCLQSYLSHQLESNLFEETINCPDCGEALTDSEIERLEPEKFANFLARRRADSPSLDHCASIVALTDTIKPCPSCKVLIERDEGCAQMLCRRCKHVFCWFCLEPLEGDFMLWHFTKGPCKDRLGHTRSAVMWYRLQVVAIFLGVGLLTAVATPFIVLSAPCICCVQRYKKRSKRTELIPH